MKMVSMLLRKRPLVAALASVVIATGCAASPTGPAAAPEGRTLEVVTAFYPLAYVAQQVAGDRAQIVSLTEPGAEPHDVELKPSQVAAVSTADLVIYEKTFQAAVDEAVAGSGNDSVLDTTSVVPLQPLTSAPDDDGHDHDHGEGGLDPHVWLDPANMITIADAVRDRLVAIDPEHAPDYRTRAEALTGSLKTLDSAFTTGLATCTRQDFITTHAAFGYLAGRYDLHQIGISGLSPDSEPSPARIAEVQEIAREHQVTTIFSETLVSPAVAESIAGDLGLVTDVLDPIEGITAQSRGTDYVAVMQANLDALRKANDCR